MIVVRDVLVLPLTSITVPSISMVGGFRVRGLQRLATSKAFMEMALNRERVERFEQRLMRFC